MRLRILLRKIAASLRRDTGPQNGSDVLDTPYRWHRKSEILGREICVFVTVALDGAVTPHARGYIAALASAGVSVIVVAVVNDAAKPLQTELPEAAAVLARENAGYDFAAWATALRLAPSILDAESLVIFANDSVFGPFAGFDTMMQRLRGSPADVVALTESDEVQTHFQSYFFAFKQRSLRHTACREFWSGVRNIESKWEVIRAYEVALRRHLERRGLTTEILFRLADPDGTNPTLFHWRELLSDGFPFMKVSVLRGTTPPLDIAGWNAALLQRGVDVEDIKSYLRSVAPRAPGLTTD